jgi:beta-N-acetylhexosaminidase
MKKLVVFTTVILLILMGVFGSILIKEYAGSKEGGTSALSSIKESLDLGKEKETEAEEAELGYYYEGNLMRLTSQAEIITYEGRDFEVQFFNPFYEDGSEQYINVIFCDELHGVILKSIGTGTDSEFYEAYRTEDGSVSWTKCAGDIWFDLDGQNYLEMLNENELIYVHEVMNEVIGSKQTEISYSPDCGDTWYDFEGNMIDAESEELLAEIADMTTEEKVAQLFVISPEALTGYELVYSAGNVTYTAMKDYPVGGLVYTMDNVETYDQFVMMLSKTQDYSMEIANLPILFVIPEAFLTEASTEDYDWLTGYDLYQFEEEITITNLQSETESADAAVNALQNGADILLMPADFTEAYEGVLDAVKDGTITEDRLDASIYRILKAKQSLLADEEETEQ